MNIFKPGIQNRPPMQGWKIFIWYDMILYDMTWHDIISLVKSRKLHGWKILAVPNKDAIETNFNFGNRCRFNLKWCDSHLIFVRKFARKRGNNHKLPFFRKNTLWGKKKKEALSVQKTLVDCIVLRRTSFVWESHQVFQ